MPRASRKEEEKEEKGGITWEEGEEEAEEEAASRVKPSKKMARTPVGVDTYIYI